MRVFVVTGAGVSAESGIPTFRGRDGYWRNLDPTKLATPEAFTRDPQLVWDWYRERRKRIRSAQPNAAHEAIARLADQTGEFLLLTQNVDDLHARAGVPAEKMVQIHGDIFVTRCSRCEFSYAERGGSPEPPGDCVVQATNECLRSIAPVSENAVDVPRCSQCNAFMRPGVVWFGEQLPPDELQRVENFINVGACDVVIVAGTTATFGYIIDWALRASRGTELYEVNPEETPLSRFATRLVRESAALTLPRIVEELLDPRCSRL